MSVYSFTTLNELPGTYINTRTRNACQQSGIHTVYDLWQRRYSFGSIHAVGKKGQQGLHRIIRKAEDIMDVMPLTTGAAAPAQKPGFTLPAFYGSLSGVGRQVAENVYHRFVMHMRASGRQKLEDVCDELTLSSLVETMVRDETEFYGYIHPHRYRSSEAGSMLYALKTFFQGDIWDNYAANLPLTLLRQEVHKLAGCRNARMDALLATHGAKIGDGTFPLSQFVSMLADVTETQPRGDAGKVQRALKACRNTDANAGKLWAEAKETVGLDMLAAGIGLLEQQGFVLPARHRLADAPYHTGDADGTGMSHGFADVFITLLYNRDYTVVKYRADGGPALMLVKSELAASFDFAELLREVYRLKSECIREAYSIDLFTLMCSFFEDDGTADEDDLIRVTAAMLQDVYHLYTSAEGELQLKRTSRKQTWECLQEVLTEKGRPCTIPELERELDSRGVVVTRETVRHHLNDKKLFVVTGETVYGLLYGLAVWKGGDKRPEAAAPVIMMIAQ